MKITVTEYWKSGIGWEREEHREIHPYYTMAMFLANKWLTEAAAGQIPTNLETSSHGDYTVAERPGRND